MPLKPKELMSEIHKEPMRELYNAVFMTLHPTATINKQGYCGTDSMNLANKIWAVASDWEALLLRKPNYRSPKHVLLAVVLYRLTRSKTVLTYLNKCNCCLSYKDILKVLRYWDDLVMKGECTTLQLQKGAVTHSSIDNIDEETESISLHFTNSNLFQPNMKIMHDQVKELVNVEKHHPGIIEELPDITSTLRKDHQQYQDMLILTQVI